MKSRWLPLAFLLACAPVFAQKISSLPPGSTPTGPELIPMVQAGATVTTTPAALALYLGIPAPLTFPLPVASGGTGTTTPGIVAGTNVTLSGTWPNQTVNSTGGSMTWPAGTASIACYSGSTSWCTGYNASNLIPANFLPAALSSSTSINGTAAPATAGTLVPNGANSSMASGFTFSYGAGHIDADQLLNLQLPTVASGYLHYNGTAWVFDTPTTGPCGSSGNLQYNNSGSCGGLTVGQGLVVSGGAIGSAYIPRVFSGTTDTILSTDCANAVEYTSSSAIAVTLPQATGSFAGCSVDIIAGGSGTVTVTPTTSTINGGSTLVIGPSRWAQPVASSGNYIAYGTAVTPAINLAGSGNGGVTGTLGTGNGGTGATSLAAAGIVTFLASGSQALGTSAIASGACATTIQVAVTGATTSDSPSITFTTDPNTVTGYKASASGALYVNAFMTSGQLNIESCNNTASSITPSAMSVHYSVTSP